MRIYVLTQEDAFYLPRLLDQLLAARRDVIGIGARCHPLERHDASSSRDP